MKPSTEWTEDDVLQLIDQKIKEGSNLDYKGCAALQTQGFVYDKKNRKYERRDKIQKRETMIFEISKDVSSFANADGGTIIYGMIEDDHFPVEIDEYPFDPSAITKEWLENIIDSNIKRKVEGLRINQIELAKSNPGKVIYAVYIPQSLQGAHQANDYRYYQRRNFKSEPMEDYQVRDVMNRFNFPVLEAEARFSDINIDASEHLYGFGLVLTNVGNVTAVNFGMDIFFPEIFLDNQSYHALLQRKEFVEGKLTKQDAGYKRLCYRNFGPDYVLFPSESITILDAYRNNRIIYSVGNNNYDESFFYRIKWTIFADSMPPRREERTIYQKF